MVAFRLGVRMHQDVEQVALSFTFFALSQSKYFTATSVTQRVPERHTSASAPVCPPVSPDPGRT
jgi:hypothetical protein